MTQGNKTTHVLKSTLKPDRSLVLKVLSEANMASDHQDDFTCPKAIYEDLRKSCTWTIGMMGDSAVSSTANRPHGNKSTRHVSAQTDRDQSLFNTHLPPTGILIPLNLDSPPHVCV